MADNSASFSKQTTRKPNRVAQISARIKSVTSSADRSKTESTSKRPAPVLPPEARKGVERTQELNDFAASKARGELTSLLDIAKSLGELRAVGEKGHKQLLTIVLPRLAQHELPPAALVPQLVQLAAASDDRKLVRFVYYLLQVILGPGSAGTPSPAPGELTPAVVSLPADISARAWAVVSQPETLAALVDLQIRTLAAAGRAVDGNRLDKHTLEAVRAVLERAEAGAGMGLGVKSKAQKRERSEAWDLHWSALLAARCSLPGKAGSGIALRSSLGIISPEPVGARHALALLTLAMRENAAGVFKEDKDLAGLMTGTVGAYQKSGYLGKTEKRGAADNRTINLQDKWARLELARLCAAAVYADWTSTQDFVDGIGAPFWSMLTLLATRDKEDLVALEAISSMFGVVHTDRWSQGAAGAAEDARNIKLRMRAWLLVSLHASKPVGDTDGAEGIPTEGASLAIAIHQRLKRALASSSSAPLKCTACRAAGAILEAATRATARGGRQSKASSELQKVVASVEADVRAVAENSSVPAVRCAAIQALLWRQAASRPPVVKTSGLAHHISSSHWSKYLLQALLERVYQVLRAAPAAAGQLLQIAGAVSAAAAASIQPDQLLELWTIAMKLPNGRSTAVSAALTLLASSGSSQAPPSRGAPPQVVARAAANEAGWLELLQNAVWWLGENANFACNEFAGSLPPPEEQNENEAPEADTTPLEAAALQAFRNPRMAAVISHLQHAALTLPSGPRTAAVQALAKVAVRSEEPYRLHCYSVLASLDASRRSSAPDTHGVACVVQPVLPILDMIYSSRLVLEQLAEQYGRMPHKWPPSIVAQLRQRHTLVEQRIQRVICSLSSASYFVLGPLSRDLLTSGVESLAPQPSLPRPALAELKTAASASSQDTLQSPLPGTARHSRHNSILSDGANPLLAGPDPLAALTENLNKHITAEVFKPRAPAPWEVSALQPPRTIPEEATFGLGESELQALPSASISRHGSITAAPDNVKYMQERGVAVHTFTAEMSDELTVRNGEEVDLEAEVDGWLHCINQYGIKGLVPASYIRILGPHEASEDVASKVFGGFGAPRHEREKSVDLLNQPDMLSALLGPQEEDDWGSPVTTYHKRDTSYHDGDLGAPPIAGEDVDGDMVIPESVPYEDPVWEEDAPDEPPPSAQEVLFEQTTVPAAPDNPFTDSPGVSARQSEDGPEQQVSITAPDTGLQASQTAQAVPSSPSPSLGAIATSGVEPAASDMQPLSARIERGQSIQSASSSRRSLELNSSAGTAPLMQPGFGIDQVADTRAPEARRLSGQLGGDWVSGGPPSRQISMVEAQARHARQASLDASGGAWVSRQNSIDMSLRATVLYEFIAEADDELSVGPGDAVLVQAEVDGWYQVTRLSDGQRGLIPASYAASLPT